MNLADGKMLAPAEAFALLDELPQRITRTLAGPPLPVSRVIDACQSLAERLDQDRAYALLLQQTGMPAEKVRLYLDEARQMLNRQFLTAMLDAAFGSNPMMPVHFTPPDYPRQVTEYWAPLGVLCHLAAGNQEALPATSVLLGLLTGNINILKLPGDDTGLSGLLLSELIRIDPALSDWIYVFDFPSSHRQAMQKLAEVADALVIWGGDDTIRAVRQSVSPRTKLIEWGHKTSFAYATPAGATDQALSLLADHLCASDQLSCSACQGIFLDTDHFAEVDRLAARFHSILDKAAARAGGRPLPLATQAQLAVMLQARRLEAIANPAEIPAKIYETQHCSVIAEGIAALTPSLMYRHCWVRPLPRTDILQVLKPYRSHLQTAALLCSDQERASLSGLLVRSGLVRITQPDTMDAVYCGMPHDGDYDLRRYARRITAD